MKKKNSTLWESFLPNFHIIIWFYDQLSALSTNHMLREGLDADGSSESINIGHNRTLKAIVNNLYLFIAKFILK